MTPLLDPDARALLEKERALLHRLADTLDAAGQDADARRAREAADALSEAFLLVVVGEFNAGKSTLVNALFGQKLMAEGPIPTTAKITLLRYGDEPFERQLSDHLVERREPAELLRFLTLVDTPGTNSIIREHQRLTEDFVPRADLVLFVTSYDRPLTATEQQFLSFIRGAWGKRFACVINKADLARSEDDLAQVVAHVRAGVEDALGFQPEVFAVSAALAYEAKTSASEPVRAALLPQSRFAPFERYVRETLAGAERLALKLAAPLDAADARLAALDAPLAARRAALAEDRARLDALHAHLDATRAALADALRRPLADIRALLEETEGRGVRFLDGAFRATNIRLLRDKDRFREEFQRQVLRDLDHAIEARVADGVDLLQRRALDLWRTALADLRASLPAAETPGLDRAAALAALEKEADRRLAVHDVREEARTLLENAQGSAELAQYAGLGAIGLGVLSGLLIVTTTLDVLGGFGIATAGVLGVASLTVLPAQRRRAIAAFHERMGKLKADLLAALEAEFARQAEGLVQRVAASMGPFEAAVAGEHAALERAEAQRDALREAVASLRSEVRTYRG